MMYCNGTAVNGPKIGERLMHKPELGHDDLTAPITCTVVYVNEAHGFYTVQFDAGYRQSYKFGG